MLRDATKVSRIAAMSITLAISVLQPPGIIGGFQDRREIRALGAKSYDSSDQETNHRGFHEVVAGLYPSKKRSFLGHAKNAPQALGKQQSHPAVAGGLTRIARMTFSRNEIRRKRGESRGENKKAEPKDAGVDRRAKGP